MRKLIENYNCFNEQEQNDKKIILDLMDKYDNLLDRTNEAMHFTVSSYIVDSTKTKVLMCYHNIYDSYSWLGGHCDGDSNFMNVAIKEAKEESGLSNISFAYEDIFSLEILPVSGHIKKGKYVSSHLHLNVTYLLIASVNDTLKIKSDENSDLLWINIDEMEKYISEKWMYDNIYKKLNAKIKELA